MVPVTFGQIREYCSRIHRVSICMESTLTYQNYRFISQVPHVFDSLYLYGVGLIESEFYGGDGLAEPSAGKLNYLPCLEFMLSERPKEDDNGENKSRG